MADVVIRRAGEGDAAEIDRLFVLMLQTIYHREEEAGFAVGYLESYQNVEGRRIYVAETGGTVAGFASLVECREDDPYLYLDDFSVAAEYRGRGIGTGLLLAVERDAAEHGLDRMALHVEAANTRARELYERMGYEEAAPGQAEEPADSRIWMRKRLGRGF